MTSYNRERFIEESIQSILDSTFKKYEFIIVDDASTDNTWNLIMKYAKLDNRIKSFQNPQNLGDYLNRNKVASYAKGKYIKYVDSDDLISKDALMLLVTKMEENPDAAFGLSADEGWIEKNKNKLFSPRDLFNVFIFEGKLLGSSPTGSIIRRDIFDFVGGFSGRQFIGDMELWLTLASQYNAIAFDKSLYYWREHEDQQMNLEKRNHSISYQRFKLLQSYINNFEFYDSSEHKKMAARNIKNIISRKILYDLCSFKFNKAFKDMRGYGLVTSDLLFSLKHNRYPSSL